MQGKIIKGIAGFYYIYAEDGNVYEFFERIISSLW